MPAAAIAGVATVGSALISSHAASKAAKTQSNAANYAADLQDRQYQQSRADLAPWRTAGGAAIGQLSDMLQPGYDYTASPGYQFRFGEGQRAVEGSAASKGMLMSGGTLKDLTRFGQGLAADDFNQQFNRVASVAAGGQQANTTLGQLGANAANQRGEYATQAANAKASGYAGNAAAWGGALNNLGSLAMMGFGGGAAPQPGLVSSVNGLFASNPGIF